MLSAHGEEMAGSSHPVERLLVVPIGDVNKDILQQIAAAVGQELNVHALVTTRTLDIPPETYNERRGQYHSTPLLSLLHTKYGKEADCVLGVIDHDLYVPSLNFVFGEADLSARVAVISLTRLRQEFYGLPPNPELFQKRALTEAVHELGHTYGLRHCSDPHCVMFFSNSLADTDRKGYRFCSRCRAQLERLRTPPRQ
jgi:archaemetzincin